jgi:hypothetical protein
MEALCRSSGRRGVVDRHAFDDHQHVVLSNISF